MGKLIWDKTGERLYETGIEKGVLYPFKDGIYSKGVAWNGLTSVSESPSGGEPTPLYADDIKYLNLISAEDFGATIEAYTYPDEFKACDGSAEIATGVIVGQQKRIPFGLSYVTKIGNDVDGSDYGRKIHIIYGANAKPTEKGYETINDSPEAITFSWELSTTPIEISGKGFKPTSHIVIDTTKFTTETLVKLENFESLLYGADEFSTSKTYSVGNYVTYGEGSSAKTYKCKTAISTPGAWDTSKWDEIGEAGPHLPLPEELVDIFGEIVG